MSPRAVGPPGTGKPPETARLRGIADPPALDQAPDARGDSPEPPAHPASPAPPASPASPEAETTTELEVTRSDLTESERTRARLIRELQELAAASAVTRERLGGELAEARAQLGAARARADRHERLEQELSDAYESRARAAAELVPLTESLRAAEQANELLATELRDATAEREDLRRRVALRGEELEAAVARLSSVEAVIGSLEGVIEQLGAETREIRSDRAELRVRLDALALHNEGLTRAMIDRDAAVATQAAAAAELRAQLGELRAESERRGAHARKLEAVLDDRHQRLEELAAERERAVQDLRRVAASRAWRWGHGTTRFLRRLTFRRTRRAGAVETLLARLETRPSLPSPPEAAEPERQ